MLEEIKDLEAIEAKAEEYISTREYRKAEALMKKLERSFLVSEATRIWVRLKARTFIQEEDFEAAHKVISENIGYVWGSPDVLTYARQINPEVSPETSCFLISITGGVACLGYFTQYPEEYVCSFMVAAASLEDGLAYLLSLVHFERKDNIKVVRCNRYVGLPEGVEHEGVIQTYPFRRATSKEKRNARPIVV